MFRLLQTLDFLPTLSTSDAMAFHFVTTDKASFSFSGEPGKQADIKLIFEMLFSINKEKDFVIIPIIILFNEAFSAKSSCRDFVWLCEKRKLGSWWDDITTFKSELDLIPPIK